MQLPTALRRHRAPKDATAAAPAYDAFISYSHSADGKLGPVLQAELERFARPWYRPRARRMFRDSANLTATPALWEAIELALASSRWFVLLASPEAARSDWIEREVSWWMEHRSARRMLIVVTGGEVAWEGDAAGAERLRTTSLPPSLTASLDVEPRWVDLTWLPEPSQIDRANPRFRDDVASIAAAVDEVEKDSLVGEHVRRARQTKRIIRGSIATLLVLLVALGVSAVLALGERNTARQQALDATSRLLVSEATSLGDAQPDLSRQLLLAAYRFSPTDQAIGGILQSTSLPVITRTDGLARAVAYSADRNLVAVGFDAGALLLNAASYERLATLTGTGGYVSTVAFSDEGRLLMTGRRDGGMQIWNIAEPRKPELLARVPVTDSIVEAIATSTRAPVVAASSSGGIAIYTIDNPARPETAAVISGFGDAGIGTGLAISADGRTLAAAADGTSVRLYTLSDPSAPVRLATMAGGSSGEVTGVAFSPDGSLLAAGGSDNTLRLWGIADRRSPRELGTMTDARFGVSSIAFAPHGAVLAAGDHGGTVRLWDVTDPLRPRLGRTLTGQPDAVQALAYSPSGHSLAVAGGELQPEDGTIRRWPVAGTSRPGALAVLDRDASTPASFTADARTMAVGMPTALSNIADPSRPRLLSDARRLGQFGRSGSLSPDGKLLVSALPLLATDVSNPARPRALPPKRPIQQGSVVRFGSGLEQVAVGTKDGDLEVWDLRRSGAPVRLSRAAGAQAAEHQVAFSADGRLLATLTEKHALQLWDASDPRKPALRKTITMKAGFASVALDPGGHLLVAGADDGRVSGWNVDEPASPVREFTLTADAGTVSAIALQPGATMMATAASLGDTVRVWDLTDRRAPLAVATFSAGDGRIISALAFAPDGRTLVAGGTATWLWSVDAAGIARRMCAESAVITRAQWSQSVPGRTYDPPCA